MPRAIDAIIDADGRVKLKEKIRLNGPRRAVVTIFEETADEEIDEITLLSEHALAADWERKEEDEAWSHLQQDQ